MRAIMRPHVRVLIADDQPRVLRGLRAVLSLFPEIELVGEAADGQECLDLVSERRPDVVLMDARMPMLDGIDATRILKDHWPRTRVLVSTIYPSYQEDALAAGADAFLLKGCQPEVLRDTIQKLAEVR